MRKRRYAKKVRKSAMWVSAAVVVTILMYFALKTVVPESPDNTEEDYPYLIESSIPSAAQIKADKNGIKEITIVPASQSGYEVCDGVYVRNSTKLKFDTRQLLYAPLTFDFKDKKGTILIVHSHGSESYAVAAGYSYTLEENDRNKDTKYNMIRIGDEVESILKNLGYTVVHDRTINDQPDYNGAYDRMMEKIKGYQAKYKDIKVVLDLHRDYLSASDGSKYKPTAIIDGEKYAQLMLLMGSDQKAFPYTKWQENLKFALKLQKVICDKYPSLMRPVELKESRYNQHLTTGSLLVEVGSSANTLDEALRSAKIFANELAKVLGG